MEENIKCPHCGAPCIELNKVYTDESNEVSYVEHVYQLPVNLQQGGLWAKGEYDRLYDQVKNGKRTVCFVDYNPWGSDNVFRDICTIKAETMEFTSRGYGYGTSKFMSGDEKQLFIELCKSMNVEWLNEGGQSKGQPITSGIAEHLLYLPEDKKLPSMPLPATDPFQQSKSK